MAYRETLHEEQDIYRLRCIPFRHSTRILQHCIATNKIHIQARKNFLQCILFIKGISRVKKKTILPPSHGNSFIHSIIYAIVCFTNPIRNIFRISPDHVGTTISASTIYHNIFHFFLKGIPQHLCITHNRPNRRFELLAMIIVNRYDRNFHHSFL